MEVSEAHILAREDGGLTVARSVRVSVVEPHLEEPPLLPELLGEVDDEDGEDPLPRRRLKAKSKVKMLSVRGGLNDDDEDELQEMDEDDIRKSYIDFLQEECRTHLEPQPRHLRRTLMKAEVQVTPDIEKVLEYHQSNNIPIQVTHTVALDDVKSNIALWTQAAVKEYDNLKNNKDAFDVVKRKDLPPGCRILPGKAVFTVKPDGSGVRRKARFVACGNYVPQEENVTELFAAGLDATSLRTVLAWTAPRVKANEWVVGSTDVRQAFVLAPWIGGPVAIQPPSISTRMGITEADDLWLIKKSIYGLREAPAVWAQFRDKELQKARWQMMVQGESVSLPPAVESPVLKEAQKRVGELMWLTSRTRPDIQYAVSIMASRVTRVPDLVNQLGSRLLDYLCETVDYRLTFKGEGKGDVIEVYTDSSFSPSSSRSHGAVGIFYLNSPITWRSSRQPLVTLSTAESELIEGIEGTLMGFSVKDLIVELAGIHPSIELHIDNQAALSLLQGSSGSWRTRHAI